MVNRMDLSSIRIRAVGITDDATGEWQDTDCESVVLSARWTVNNDFSPSAWFQKSLNLLVDLEAPFLLFFSYPSLTVNRSPTNI